MPLQDKVRLANFVMDNSGKTTLVSPVKWKENGYKGNLAVLGKQVDKLWQQLEYIRIPRLRQVVWMSWVKCPRGYYFHCTVPKIERKRKQATSFQQKETQPIWIIPKYFSNACAPNHSKFLSLGPHFL